MPSTALRRQPHQCCSTQSHTTHAGSNKLPQQPKRPRDRKRLASSLLVLLSFSLLALSSLVKPLSSLLRARIPHSLIPIHVLALSPSPISRRGSTGVAGGWRLSRVGCRVGWCGEDEEGCRRGDAECIARSMSVLPAPWRATSSRSGLRLGCPLLFASSKYC